MAINKLYWITHAPIAMLLGLCACRLTQFLIVPESLIAGLFSISYGLLVVIVYIDWIAPIVEQHDPRLHKQFLWE